MVLVELASVEECFKVCSSRSKLVEHMRKIHMQIRNHECDKCEKRFFDLEALTRHVTAVHDKLKPFLCEHCPFQCARTSNLNLHRRKSHGATTWMTKARLIEMVKNGEHPYYDDEKFQILLVVKST